MMGEETAKARIAIVTCSLSSSFGSTVTLKPMGGEEEEGVVEEDAAPMLHFECARDEGMRDKKGLVDAG